jgi:hypothetical protein
MSVLIRGMEMPKDCWKCPVQGIPACFKHLDFSIRGKRPVGCPLVEAPVVHGKWIPSEDDSKVFGCSECHEIVYGTPSYCPRCGARMDGE